VECRIGAGRRGFLEEHDAVASLAAQLFKQGPAARRHAQHRAVTRQRDKSLRIHHLHILPLFVANSQLWIKTQQQSRAAGRSRPGYLVNRETRRGRPARIVLGDPMPKMVKLLPEPGELGV
jgi:hypothetical protein